MVRYLPDGALGPQLRRRGCWSPPTSAALTWRAPWSCSPTASWWRPEREVPALTFCLGCYLPDGRLDATFGVGGKVTTDFGSLDERALDLLLQPDGKLVAAGSFHAGITFDIALARGPPTAAWTPPSVSGAKSLLIWGGRGVAQPSSCSPMASWSRQERLQATFCWARDFRRMGIRIPPSASGAKSLLISGGRG